MDALPNADEVAERLRTTALRGFGPDVDVASGIALGRKTNRITISWTDCPIPAVLKLGLALIDLDVSSAT